MQSVICLLPSWRHMSVIPLTLCSILAVEHFHNKIRSYCSCLSLYISPSTWPLHVYPFYFFWQNCCSKCLHVFMSPLVVRVQAFGNTSAFLPIDHWKHTWCNKYSIWNNIVCCCQSYMSFHQKFTIMLLSAEQICKICYQEALHLFLLFHEKL